MDQYQNLSPQQPPQIPNVAVVVCNYNYGQYICDAITSADIQDYPAKTIFVVDDCSQDDSIKNVYDKFLGPGLVPPTVEENEEYRLCHLRGSLSCDLFIFQLKKNGGPSKARNVAINYALRGNFHIVAILDADDCWLEGKLTKSVATILQDPERIGGVYSDYLIHNTTTGVTKYECKRSYDFNELWQNCIIHSGCVFNGLALREFGGYDESLRVCEDYDLFLDIATKYIFIHLAEPLVFVRVQPMNSTDTVQKQVWEECYHKVKTRPRPRKGT